MKKVLFIGVLIGLLLAGGALALRPRLLAGASAQASGGERTMQIAVAKVENINGVEQRAEGVVDVHFVNPPELPARSSDVHGLYLGRDGNALTLGLGAIEVDVEVTAINDAEPQVAVNASHSGDTVTVNIAPDATIYLETTPHPDPSPAEITAGEMVVARTLTAGSLADLGDNFIVEAWGSTVDGTLLADMVVLRPIR